MYSSYFLKINVLGAMFIKIGIKKRVCRDGLPYIVVREW